MVHIGGPGAGQTTKMVNQIAIAGVIQGLSEALRFAQASKLDTDKVFEAVSGGAAASWQMLNRWGTMAKDEFDFGFAVDWMRKDLGLALDEARVNGATLPVARSEEHTSELQSLMRISYAVFCLKKKTTTTRHRKNHENNHHESKRIKTQKRPTNG